MKTYVTKFAQTDGDLIAILLATKSLEQDFGLGNNAFELFWRPEGSPGQALVYLAITMGDNVYSGAVIQEDYTVQQLRELACDVDFHSTNPCGFETIVHQVLMIAETQRLSYELGIRGSDVDREIRQNEEIARRLIDSLSLEAQEDDI